MINSNLLHVDVAADGQLRRRELLCLAGGFAGAWGLGVMQLVGLHAEEIKKRGKRCVMVFLNGAPSQLETFDPKPGVKNGGATKTIQTKIPGVNFAEYWPKLAALTDQISVIRSIAGKEAAHERGQYHLRTGRRLTGASKFPHFGSVVAHKLGDPEADVPNFVSLGNTLSAGFLGVKVAPFVVNKPGELPDNVKGLVDDAAYARRLALVQAQDADLERSGATAIAAEHRELYRKARNLMTSSRLKAFELSSESDQIKERYGKSGIGQSCLVARRLIESGIPFVEVQRGGWDMHDGLWQKMPGTAADTDQAVAALISDLQGRGLLQDTLVLVLGEFGRTPMINSRGAEVGRDHWARNFNMLMAGGGIKGGVCIGKTSDDGMEISDGRVEVDDLFQTMCHAMGIDASEELITPEGRPMRIVDAGAPIQGLLG